MAAGYLGVLALLDVGPQVMRPNSMSIQVTKGTGGSSTHVNLLGRAQRPPSETGSMYVNKLWEVRVPQCQCRRPRGSSRRVKHLEYVGYLSFSSVIIFTYSGGQMRANEQVSKHAHAACATSQGEGRLGLISEMTSRNSTLDNLPPTC